MLFTNAPAATYATERDLDWFSEIEEIVKVARLMGMEFMPWQRQVIEVATEYKIIKPGDFKGDRFVGQRYYHYSEVVITVPRQSGKTKGVNPVFIHRLLTRPGTKSFMTAQTGSDAASRMQDLIDIINRSPIKKFFKPRLSNGSKGFTVPATGSTLRQFAPVEGAIHGESPYIVGIDEFWKFNKQQGENLIGGISPSQIALNRQGQVWYYSTRGTVESEYMNDLIDLARKGGEADRRMCYFEWSMNEELDPYAPESWETFHPALNNTIEAADIKAEIGKISASEFKRAYCNIITESAEPIILPEVWDTLRATPTPPKRENVTISFEVSPQLERAAVMATFFDKNQVLHTRVLHSAPGATWLESYLKKVWEEWQPLALAADDAGANRQLIDRLTASGIDVATINGKDFLTACSSFLVAARDDRTVRHCGSVAFSKAVAHAHVHYVGDSFKFSRSKSTAPISELIAAAVGAWAHTHQTPKETPFWETVH